MCILGGPKDGKIQLSKSLGHQRSKDSKYVPDRSYSENVTAVVEDVKWCSG